MVISRVAIPKNWIKCILLSQKNKQRVVVAEHRAQCRDEGMDEGRRGASAPTSHWQGLKETELLPLLTRCFTPKTREFR